MRKTFESPYIASPNRLADVIAAIQVMGLYEWHMRNFDSWATSISGEKTLAAHWQRVFSEHPEFFRLDTTREMASLVWRRSFPKNYHADMHRVLSPEEIAQLAEPEFARLARPPLAASEIKTLIDTAINLHSRAVELRRESRWWMPLAGAIGALAGSILGALIRP